MTPGRRDLVYIVGMVAAVVLIVWALFYI